MFIYLSRSPIKGRNGEILTTRLSKNSRCGFLSTPYNSIFLGKTMVKKKPVFTKPYGLTGFHRRVLFASTKY